MQTATVTEDGKPAYEVKIEDFDLANKKGAFDAGQFNEPGTKLSVPQGQFTLAINGETYGCRMLIATHFVLIEDADHFSKIAAAPAGLSKH